MKGPGKPGPFFHGDCPFRDPAKVRTHGLRRRAPPLYDGLKPGVGMTIADTAQLFGAVIPTVALVWAILQYRFENKRRIKAQDEAARLRGENESKAAALRLKNEQDILNTRRVEIYQRLEIESNRVFEFEARHPQLVPMMKRHLAPVEKLDDLVVQNEYGDRMDARQIAMVARKYYEMNCNLFEIAARLRKLELIDRDVFGSWVAWYFDTGTVWGFRALWADLRDNYTADLRAIFDPLCIALISGWDVAHAQGQLEAIDTTGRLPDISTAELEHRRVAFYAQIGDLLDCDTIRGWLAQVDATQLPEAHPLAYS